MEPNIIWGVEVSKHNSADKRVIVAFDEDDADDTLKSFTAAGYTGRVVFREIQDWKDRDNAKEKVGN